MQASTHLRFGGSCRQACRPKPPEAAAGADRSSAAA